MYSVSNSATWVKQKNTGAKKLVFAMEWLQDGPLNLNWERREEDMEAAQSTSYPQEVCKLNDKNREFYIMHTSPTKEHCTASLPWLN